MTRNEEVQAFLLYMQICKAVRELAKQQVAESQMSEEVKREVINRLADEFRFLK